MKKFIVIAMALFICFSVSAQGLAEEIRTGVKAEPAPAPVVEVVPEKVEPAVTEAPAAEEEPAVVVETPAVVVEAPKAPTYKLGLGVVYSDSSTTTQAAYSATVAAVVVDEEGKIVDCRIDVAQNKMNGDAVDPEATFLSKYEKGYDYNMVKFSEATNEWFQQADAFASYVIGKTGEEVAALPTRVRGEDEPHPGYVVTTDETLFASCSITITEFMEAVSKAAKDPYAQSFQADGFTLGVACNSTAEDSTAPADGKNGTIKMHVEFAAAAVDGEGKILACVTDAIQPNHEVDDFGEIVGFTYKGTKKELGYDYNMVKYSEATNEWFQQAGAFEDYCEGKTADEVLALPTRVRGENEPHPGYVVTADETLFASCSISIPGFQSVIAKAAKNAAPEVEEAAAPTYKLGLGVVYSDSSTTTQAAYSATVAAVVVDEEGKIVDCRIDVAQNKMNGDAVDPEATFLSKYEKGYDYNMVKFSEATNEWFQQADAFASYVIGKTGEEVAALPTRVRGEDEPHPGYVVTTDETLFASCSITITEFMEAVSKAAKDPYAQSFQADGFTLGVACNSTAEDSTAPADGKNGTIKMHVEFAAAAVDGEGKILACVTDAIQPNHEVDDFGEIVGFTYKGTKKELGYDYNMVKYSEATNEWFQQAGAFEDYCEGKTADEVLALPTRVRGENEPHPGYVVTADETLFASCSISIPGFQSVIAKAAQNAK